MGSVNRRTHTSRDAATARRPRLGAPLAGAALPGRAPPPDAAGAARRRAGADGRRIELRLAEPAPRRPRGRRRADRVLPPLRQHGRARARAGRGVGPRRCARCCARRARAARRSRVRPDRAVGRDPRRPRARAPPPLRLHGPRVGSSGNAVLRHAIRTEIRLFASELATDLARFPILRDWTTADLQMLAGLFVDTMIATIDAILEASSAGAGADGSRPTPRPRSPPRPRSSCA